MSDKGQRSVGTKLQQDAEPLELQENLWKLAPVDD